MYCDDCHLEKETTLYSFDDGDVRLCEDCADSEPHKSKRMNQIISDMKQDERDDAAKEKRGEL